MHTSSLSLALTSFLVAATQAQQAGTPTLTLDDATRVIDAAKAESRSLNCSSVIAVVDGGGWLIKLERMDNPAMLVSVELAPGKARAAALYRKQTAELEKSIDTGRVAAVTAPGLIQMQGGIPLVINSVIVGAVGVSTDTPAHDQAIAEAASKALGPCRLLIPLVTGGSAPKA